MSDVQRKTDKPSQGTAQVDLDGKTQMSVFYLFADNFRIVRLSRDGEPVEGATAQLYLNDPPYRLQYTGKDGFWQMLDGFIS
jgi:hypothetical protein